MAFDEKVRLLRRYEQRVYSICLHVLADERRAAQAAEEALIELFDDPAFTGGSDGERSRLARAAAVRRCFGAHLTERGFAYAHG